jgi:hypothetical protein
VSVPHWVTFVRELQEKGSDLENIVFSAASVLTLLDQLESDLRTAITERDAAIALLRRCESPLADSPVDPYYESNLDRSTLLEDIEKFLQQHPLDSSVEAG